jgi:hypothetical protein
MKMAKDVTKAWITVTGQASADFALSKEELKLIQSITDVIKNNCDAAISMTMNS